MEPESNFICEYEAESLYFVGEINIFSAHELAKTIRRIEHEKELLENKTLSLFISSDGGSLNDGLKLYDLIKRSPLEITVIAEGWVASSAILLLCAAKKAIITQHTFLLLHEFQSCFDGRYSDYGGHMKYLDKIMTKVINIYNTQFKEPIQEERLHRDWIVDAHEALELGLIDEIV
jgi:ATP-dependent protease ClpP protease subunit